MSRYAAETSVPIERSRAEIEGILRRYGADGFRYGWADREQRRVEQIEFTVHERLIRFTLIMPSQHDPEFARTPARGHRRSDKDRIRAWDQGCRQRWRALALCIKAKLEAVECGISEFESEFMAQIVDPGSGRTVGEIMRPQIAQRYAGIDARLSLPGLPAPEE
ncbi:MAG: hypothetical protein KY476_00570 [Planctomycetes bacterium]|nr:hypothetical protein [Planctomycetota bacterium]